MQVFVKGRRTLVLDVNDGTLVEAVQEQVAAIEGLHVQDVRLAFGGARLRPAETLASRGIRAGSTLITSVWLPGGAGRQANITVKPRVQKDKWSLYWKESMETKTELLEDVTMELKSGLTVADVQQSVHKKFGWPDASTLQRLEGFKAAWDSVVFMGRLLEPGAALEACGVGPGAVLVLVRQVLVPEGWRIIKEGEDEDDLSSEEEF